MLLTVSYREHRVIGDSLDKTEETESSVLGQQRTASLKRPAPYSPFTRSKITCVRELAVGFLIHADLPFAVLSNPFMTKLLESYNLNLAKEQPLGRTTLSQDLAEIFRASKGHVEKELGGAQTSIHISFDLWTSPNRLAFIAIFAHFLDREYRQQNRLIGFRRQLGTHAGENIANTLEEVIKDWGIGSRLGVAVCDNVSSNDTCLRSLFPRFIPQMDDDDVKARRIRCFGHILNLVAKAFLFGEESDAFEIQSDFYDTLGQYEEGLEHWRRKGPIGKLHNIVKFIRASPQRSEAFRNIAQECDDSEDFIFSEVSSKELELRQNNTTRWNSTYLMIKRAWEKQAEIRAYLLSLDLSSASTQLPRQDYLTTDDWRLLNDIQHVLEPIYSLTMRTQGHAHSGIHGHLWELMTGMEFVLEHLEEWKTLYDDPTTELAAESASQQPSEPLSSGPGPDSMPRPSTPTTFARDRPARQSKLPQHLQDFEVATPLRHQQQRHWQPAATATARFDEGALPDHTRSTYTARSVSRISNIAADERTYIRACINNAWVKLDGYYTLLGESPLYAASIILHPGLGISFLEANWTSTVQLTWLRDAKRQLKEFLEEWYPTLGDGDMLEETPTPSPSPMTPAEQKDPSRFTQWIKSKHPRLTQVGSELDRYYRLEAQEVSDPIQWWVDHKGSFPRLSRFALDILAIPAMADDCKRAFSTAKLTITSQRHSLKEVMIEMLQLMKNWTRNGCIELGGVRVRAAQCQE